MIDFFKTSTLRGVVRSQWYSELAPYIRTMLTPYTVIVVSLEMLYLDLEIKKARPAIDTTKTVKWVSAFTGSLILK